MLIDEITDSFTAIFFLKAIFQYYAQLQVLSTYSEIDVFRCHVLESDTCIIKIVIYRMITDMRITRIDETDIFCNANCQYHFGIITLDISYHIPIYNSS